MGTQILNVGIEAATKAYIGCAVDCSKMFISDNTLQHTQLLEDEE